MMTLRLWHGGAPGLNPGDLIVPGHSRRVHDGCPWCAARQPGSGVRGIDPPTGHQDMVYLTTSRLYALYYASLWGYGDLYRVEPIGALIESGEDTIETFMATGARVLAATDRAVLLTWSQRRRLWREWGAADEAAKTRRVSE